MKNDNIGVCNDWKLEFKLNFKKQNGEFVGCKISHIKSGGPQSQSKSGQKLGSSFKI